MLALVVLSGCAAGNGSRQVVGRPVAMPVLPSAAAPATLAQARELDRQGEAGAVDLYYQSATQAAVAVGIGDGPSEQIYHQALAGLVDAGQRYGRLDPRRQLIVVEGGTRVVPIRYLGFTWRPDDFSRLLPAERETSREIANHYATPGLGVPLIGERVSACPQETFFRPWQPFAVTAVLRPDVDATAPAPGGHVLEFYNPLALSTVCWNGAARPLARDLTAPMAAIVNEAPRQYLRGFTAPYDTAVQPQLVMLEPYHRGKIPVIFIHGLYSDPITWADMINDLRAQQDLYDQFQFWTFRYPTGGDLLASAAALRRDLQLARDTYDAEHSDPAMDRVVLVGHSLGGLVSKMQVTRSYDLLWREVAVQPFDVVRATPEMRQRLAQGFFFEPVPSVTRVVFIGTPHRGSGMARRAAGRVGNLLVSFGTEQDAAYQQLIDDNWEVFKPIVRRQRPTTITLLDPESPFLAALARMPVQCPTRFHSIIGTGSMNPLVEPGDGMVPVSSAEHYGDSELMVPARHEKIHRHPEAIAEVMRILRVHLHAAPCRVGQPVGTSYNYSGAERAAVN